MKKSLDSSQDITFAWDPQARHEDRDAGAEFPAEVRNNFEHYFDFLEDILPADCIDTCEAPVEKVFTL